MLTSEQQKIYNVKVPKGGYGYYTLYHGIYDPAKNIDERPAYAQTGDLFEPEGSSVVYKATRKNGKTTWTIDENAQRQSESGESGGGSGGGGAEKFIVELSEDKGEWNTKTSIADIVAADEANQVVVCKVAYEGDGAPPFEIPLSVAIDNAVLFGGVSMQEKATAIVAYGMLDGDATGWNVQAVELGSSNAPLIVTMTAGSTEGQFVGDKTYKEVYDAFIVGKTVVVYLALNIEGNQAISACNVAGAGYAESEGNAYYHVKYSLDTAQTPQGSANDYITATMGN